MNRKILLIEDHEEFRKIVRIYLKKQDNSLEVFEASTGELGIVKALREKPSIVLMDIGLPNMSGIDAAGRIKKYLPDCKIIVLTMFETEAFREVFKSSDITAYIGKSELFEKLMPLIEEHLEVANTKNK